MTACVTGLAEVGLGGFLHLLQDERGDLLRANSCLPSASTQASPLPAFDDLVGDELLVLLRPRVVVAAADEALDGEERVDRGW